MDVPSTINKQEGSELLDVSSDEGDVIQEGQEDPAGSPGLLTVPASAGRPKTK